VLEEAFGMGVSCLVESQPVSAVRATSALDRINVEVLAFIILTLEKNEAAQSAAVIQSY
jgi:hypothetical protein